MATPWLVPAPLTPNSIFLCYRRADSEVMVDRLYEELAKVFGRGTVFRDIDTIPPGVDFPTFIQQSLRDCAVALVFIGQTWATSADRDGAPRLLDPDDHVRIEIETALALPHARVIPVLVLHGVMPPTDALPDSLRPLRRRNGLTIRSAGADYRHDVESLIHALRRSLAEVETARRNSGADLVDDDTMRKRGAARWTRIFTAKKVGPILASVAKGAAVLLLLWAIGKGLKLLPESWTRPQLHFPTPHTTPAPPTPKKNG